MTTTRVASVLTPAQLQPVRQMSPPMGLAGPAFMAGASMAVTAEEQGAVAGVAGSCGPLGFTIGPLVGGFLYQIDPTLPYWFTVAIYIPLLGFVIHHARKVD